MIKVNDDYEKIKSLAVGETINMTEPDGKIKIAKAVSKRESEGCVIIALIK